jgi:hypothetical protein
MPKPDHRSQMARAWLHFHAARKGRGSGSAAPRVDWPVYPRPTEHNTLAEGGNRRWAETARQNVFQSRSPWGDQRPAGPGPLRGGAGGCRKNAPAHVGEGRMVPGRIEEDERDGTARRAEEIDERSSIFKSPSAALPGKKLDV